MHFDATASAYGLIQVVYADVTDHLAAAVVILRKRTDRDADFKRIFGSGFERILDAFKSELRQLAAAKPVTDDVTALIEVCRLAKWRNDRIHARVREFADGWTLYDW